MYKALLQGGHFNRTSKSIDKATRWDASSFAESFVSALGPDVFVAICTKGDRSGAFVIAEALAACSSDAKAKAKTWFTPAVVKDIKESDMKGKAVLLEHIL